MFCRDTKATVSAAAAAGGAAGDGDDDDVDATVAAAAEGTITTAAAPTAKGAAGGVVRHHAALATGSSPFVAVKIVRSNDTMRRAGMKELDLLRALATADPRGKYHCVRLLATFEHRNHLCLVFEPLAMNLKEVQNKFGKGVGIALVAVRAYAKQLLLSLALLAKLRVIHADIKPHNVLANDKYNVIKVSETSAMQPLWTWTANFTSRTDTLRHRTAPLAPDSLPIDLCFAHLLLFFVSGASSSSPGAAC